MVKNGRKLLILLLVFMMMVTMLPISGQAARHATKDIKIIVGDLLVMSDVHPYIKNDRTYVPIRFIAEELGYEVGWDQQTKTVHISSGNQKIALTIGSDQAKVNGQTVALDAPPELKDDRTFVPLRFIAETMGEQVDYNASSRVAYINNPNIVINQYFVVKYYGGNNDPIKLDLSFNPEANSFRQESTGSVYTIDPDSTLAADFVDQFYTNRSNGNWINDIFDGNTSPGFSSNVPSEKQLKDEYYVAPTADDFIVGSWWGTSHAENIGYVDSYFKFSKIGTNRYEYTNQFLTSENAELITKGEAIYDPDTGNLHIYESTDVIKAESPFANNWVTFESYLGFDGPNYMYYLKDTKMNFSKY